MSRRGQTSPAGTNVGIPMGIERENGGAIAAGTLRSPDSRVRLAAALDFGDELLDAVFCIAEEHPGIVEEEERVLNPGVATAHTPL